MNVQIHSEPYRRVVAGTLPLTLLLTACGPALAQTPPAGSPEPATADAGTLQVTGQAQIAVPTDRVRINLTVETEAPSASEATQENARKMEEVIQRLRALEAPGLDIETYGYSLSPEYQVSREGTGNRSISGYRVQNNVGVTLPDVEATGRVLDTAIEAGANRIAGLRFEASDTRAARMEALRLAVGHAREQADAMAAAMGVELGKALEVQGGANAPNPRSMGGMMLRAAAEATTPVEGGDQMVTASVTVKYRILEEGL